MTGEKAIKVVAEVPCYTPCSESRPYPEPTDRQPLRHHHRNRHRLTDTGTPTYIWSDSVLCQYHIYVLACLASTSVFGQYQGSRANILLDSIACGSREFPPNAHRSGHPHLTAACRQRDERPHLRQLNAPAPGPASPVRNIQSGKICSAQVRQVHLRL